MKEHTSMIAGLESLADSLEKSVAASGSGVAKKVLASVRAFLRDEVTPQSFERFERRLESLFREMARRLLERTVNQIESSCRPQPVT